MTKGGKREYPEVPALYGCGRAGQVLRARDDGGGIRRRAGGGGGSVGNVSVFPFSLPWMDLNSLMAVWMRIKQKSPETPRQCLARG